MRLEANYVIIDVGFSALRGWGGVVLRKSRFLAVFSVMFEYLPVCGQMMCGRAMRL